MKNLEDVIRILSANDTKWQSIKKILEEDIKQTQSLIMLIDAEIEAKHDKFSKLN